MWFVARYPLMENFNLLSIQQSRYRARESYRFSIFCFMETPVSIIQISIVLQSPHIPDRKNKCYRKGIDEWSGQLFAPLFYSSLIKHMKNVAIALLSHILANTPPQLSLSPTSCRDRVSMAELIRTDSVSKPQGLKWACPPFSKPSNHGMELLSTRRRDWRGLERG